MKNSLKKNKYKRYKKCTFNQQEEEKIGKD